MNVLFEDDGQLKAGTVLADHDASLQVEAASGKRLKVKAGSVLMRFASPGAAEVLAHAQRLAAELDAGFLWEASGDGEFGSNHWPRRPETSESGRPPRTSHRPRTNHPHIGMCVRPDSGM